MFVGSIKKKLDLYLFIWSDYLIFICFQVYYVEEEMRQLLQETASNKKAMEDKIKRITYVLSDIQQDLWSFMSYISELFFTNVYTKKNINLNKYATAHFLFGLKCF